MPTREGEEGKFYVWTRDEVLSVLGEDDAHFFAEVYDVTPRRQLGRPHHPQPARPLALRSPDEERRLAALRDKLLAARGKRVRPGWDDKVLADWNGLMIAALARAVGRVRAARVAASSPSAPSTSSSTRMSDDGRLLHAYRDGRAKAPATASDYANMIWAALRLNEATDEPRYFEQAVAWVDVLDHHYWVEGGGGYATSADDTRDVIVRLRPGSDDATPNANGIMVANLVALAR